MKRSPMRRAAPKPKRAKLLVPKALGESVVSKGPWRSAAYRAEVRLHPCLVCGAAATEAHHARETLPRTMGKRVGDEWCVPLCDDHHRALHRESRTFWSLHQIDAQAWCRGHIQTSTRRGDR